MAITPITGNYANSANTTLNAVSSTTKATKTETEESSTKVSAREIKDTFVKSSEVETERYKAPKRLSKDQLKALQDQQVESFKNMMSNMLTSQADKAKVAKNGLNITADMFSRIVVTPEQQAEAQQAISEDGEWGVNAVATRIMDMAVALSGGDSSKASVLRTAVEKGFKEAGMQWGQELPEICKDTQKEIDKRFDYWEQNGSMDGYEYKSTAAEVEDE